MSAEMKDFFHAPTFSITYLLWDSESKKAAVIDCILDYDPISGRTSTKALDEVISSIEKHGLDLEWILETHPHADHMTGARTLQGRLGGKIAIGAAITKVQAHWRDVYGLGPDFPADGSCFDRLLEGGDVIALGELEIGVLATPGHTPTCVTYLADSMAFVGDAIFMPDFGTARVDFPGGDAGVLFDSIRRILALPPKTRIFVGHDYGSDGRPFAWESSVAEQRSENKHVKDGIEKDDFIKLRHQRDKELTLPMLLLAAMQVNIRGGELPAAESSGNAYLKIPLNVF